MKMKKNYLIIIGILLSYFAYSQDNPKVDEEILFSSTDGMEIAKKYFKKAEKYFEEGLGTYDEALKNYLKVYEYNPNSKVINYKIGICYIETTNRKKSLDFFLKSSPEVSEHYYLYLARAYQYNFMFDKAEETYNTYFEEEEKKNNKNIFTKFKAYIAKGKYGDPKDIQAKFISECKTGKELTSKPLDVFIINLGPIVNSSYDDYSPVLSYNDSILYFTSRRPVEEPRKKVSRFKFKERIMKVDNNGITSPAKEVDGIPVLSYGNNTSVAGFSKTENRIYYYRGVAGGRLYSSEYKDDRWRNRFKVKNKVNHISCRETAISYDEKGNIYFVADRTGGLGEGDIWYVEKKDSSDKYKKPVVLGKEINTAFDEKGVFVTLDGNTLFFASNGRKGMGGFDIYKSVKNEKGEWQEAVNMGYPINSVTDEVFYRQAKDTMIAVYATTREDSYGGLDIYTIHPDLRMPYKLTGTVTDATTGENLYASVSIYDSKTQALIKNTRIQDFEDSYSFDFKDKGDYLIQVENEGYKSISEKVKHPEKKRTTITQNIQLEKLKHPFVLQGKITDSINGAPLVASIICKLQSNTDSIVGRTISKEYTGKYSIAFEDKLDLLIEVNAEDYFDKSLVMSSENEQKDSISVNFNLKKSRIKRIIKGLVSNADGTTYVGATISFIMQGEVKPFKVIKSNDTTGVYSTPIYVKGPFQIDVEADDYIFQNKTFEFLETDTVVEKNFSLEKMKTGVKFVANNILFNFGKSTLKLESYTELNRLVKLLSENPESRIEISGHTDNIGSTSANKNISMARALAAKNYIVSQGIEQDRIEAKGYGHEHPIDTNDTEKGRAKNRRVEVKIL